MNAKKSIVAAAAFVLSIGLAAGAHAQDTTVEKEEVGPNRVMLQSGVLVLGLSYVPAAVVAMTNSRSDDNYLYLPVAGPWLDLGHRNPCTDCSREDVNKALLITDGVFQGIGALNIIGSFLFMERTTIQEHAGHKGREFGSIPGLPLSIRPGSVSGGYGVIASSTF